MLIDTNIYWKDPQFKGLPFQALERLCKAGIVQLYVPYIVEEEVRTQQSAHMKKDVETTLGGLRAMLRRNPPERLGKPLAEMEAGLEAIGTALIADASAKFAEWIKSIKAERRELTLPEASAAWSSYFDGQAPLKSPKVREDIPDAFIFQSVVAVAGEVERLFVIVEDGKLASACKSISNTATFASLADFVDLDAVQAEMLELDVVENLELIRKAIEEYESETGELSACISEDGGKQIAWTQIHSNLIRDDNHEATISSYHDPSRIDFDFERLRYYGKGQFGLPFSFEITVGATYYLYKADYYAMDDERRSPSVSDHNDHYFEAEEEFEVRVRGLLKISIGKEALKEPSLENIGDSAAVSIDKVVSIKVLEDNSQ